MQELITAFEVVQAAPVKRDYPTNYLCTTKDNIVLAIFRKCLSVELFEALIADIVPMVNVLNYNPGTEYNEDDKILYDGVVYISNISNNTSPLSSDNWRVQEKFVKPCYNELWNNYLKRFLAFRVIYSSVEYSTFQAGSKGVTQFNTDDTGIGSAGVKGLSLFKASIWDDSVDIFNNMTAWMQDADNKACFTGLNLFTDNCATGVCNIRKRRRIAFRY